MRYSILGRRFRCRFRRRDGLRQCSGMLCGGLSCRFSGIFCGDLAYDFRPLVQPANRHFGKMNADCLPVVRPSGHAMEPEGNLLDSERYLDMRPEAGREGPQHVQPAAFETQVFDFAFDRGVATHN